MKKAYIPIIFTGILLLVLLFHINYLRFVCDDAFISFRYAKNFLDGYGLVYNIGERVEGYTNFLWTLLLGLFMRLRLEAVVVSQVLGILFSLGTVVLLLRLNRRVYPAENLFNYLAPVFLVSCGAYAAWSTGGLETSFYTFLVFLGSFFFISGMDEPKHFVFSGLTFALVCLTRLDGLILAGITFVFLFSLSVVGKKIKPGSLWLWSLCFLVPFLVYFAWRWSYYGRFLPNTYYIKLGHGPLYRQGFLYLFDFFNRFWIWLTVIPLSFLGESIRSNPNLKPIVVYFACLTSAFCFYVVYAGGDFMDMFRFLVPVLPFFFFLVQEGFRGIYYSGKALAKKKRRNYLVIAEIFLIGFSILVLAFPSRESNKAWSRRGIDSIGLLRQSVDLWSKVGLTLKAAAEPGDTMATTAAGAIPYYSELYTIDQLGLVLLDQSQLRVQKSPRPGHYKEVTKEFLLSRKPTYIIGHPTMFTEEEVARGVLVARAEEIFLSKGYEAKLLTVKMSENESKYLYCLSLKETSQETTGRQSSATEEQKSNQ
ncbi:MAG: hypothetical protein GTO24_12870 [candidate division Zixibacteria bacterium]|nr:hypothetical protein [candidate division Zixibacteria bacterium]